MKITALEQYNSRMPRQIWQWRDAAITEHAPVMSDLIANYAYDCRSNGGYVQANHNLRRVTAELGAPMFSIDGLSWVSATADDEQLCEYADIAAEVCADAASGEYSTAEVSGFMESGEFAGADVYALTERVRGYVEMLGVDFPLTIRKRDTPEQIREKMLAAVARASCPRWWRRQLRGKFGQQVEQLLRQLGRVQKKQQPYLSDWAFKRWQTAQKRNRSLLSSMEAENEEGAVVNLVDARDKSSANPVNREAEFFVRSRGFQEIADELKLPRLFLTLTAPSKFHSRHHHGPRNSKYNGADPSEVQKYLSGVWARIRARWAKLGIKPFGFRVVEPHHDGTPHWHMLLYFAVDEVDTAWGIFSEVALEEEREEVRGKEKVRVDCKRLKEGESATGYLAKYISKNLTGNGVELDFEADCYASEGSRRAVAWASLWGIRQFQQIGTVSVTVWRELRRRGDLFVGQGNDGLGDIPLFEEIREAADKSEWRTFVELMGGPTCKRKEQTIRPQQLPQQEPNAYGEEVERLRGVIMRGAARFIRTRLHEWKIRRVVEVKERPQLYAERDQLMPPEKMRGGVKRLGPYRSALALAEYRGPA